MARTAGSVGDKTAAAVRAAARRLFAQSGYPAVSMRAIATEVGIQAGALYNHFPTKQAILLDLMRAHMTEVLEASEAAVPREGDPVARLNAFTRFHLRHHLPRGDAVFISYMELRSLEPENFREIDALRGRYEGRLIAILRDGREAGLFSIRDDRVTAMAIIAMLTGVTSWYREGGRLGVSEIETIYLELVARSVGLTVAEGV